MGWTRRFALVVNIGVLGACGGRYDVGGYPGAGGGASSTDATGTMAGSSGGSSGASGTMSVGTSMAGTSMTGTSMAGTSMTGTPGSPTGGMGGSGGVAVPVDFCVLSSMKSCKAEGCHGVAPAANLTLTPEVLTQGYRTLVDRPNGGTAGITSPGDPAGCMGGAFKIIDSQIPERSLIALKVWPIGIGATPPCGSRMPVIGAFTEADRACVLNWIESVIAASR